MNQEKHEVMTKYRKEIDSVITESFEAAKQKDEAEFCASLMKHANLSPWDNRNTLKNFEQLFGFLGNVVLSGQHSAEDILRLSLLLYCHFFEWTEMFNLLYDLSKIASGERAGNIISAEGKNREEHWKELRGLTRGEMTDERIQNAMSLLDKLDNGPVGIAKKIRIISGINLKIGGLLTDLFDSRLRNGFSHNNYSFVDEGIRVFDETKKKTFIYSWDKVNTLMNETKSFAGILIIKWREYLSSYKDKHLKGQYCEYKISYNNNRFRITFIQGSLPLGIYDSSD